MTVAAEIPLALYDGDGVTVAFPAPWRYLDVAHLQVTRIASDGTETALTLGVDYAATAGPTDAGGTVTTTFPPASGQTLRITRATPRSQATAYPTTGAFPAASHELALDKLTLAQQELDEKQSRSLMVSAGETPPVVDAASISDGQVLGKVAGKIKGVTNDPASAADSAAQALLAKNDALAAEANTLAKFLDTQQLYFGTLAAVGGVQPYYPGARSFVPRGVTGATIGAAGSGGTNGTYDCPITGSNFTIAGRMSITVSGGAVTAAVPSGPGLYIGASPTVGTVDLSGIVGLTGASVTPVAGYLRTVGQFYLTDHSTNTRKVSLFKNVGNVATLDREDFDPFSAGAAVDAVAATRQAFGVEAYNNGLALAQGVYNGDYNASGNFTVNRFTAVIEDATVGATANVTVLVNGVAVYGPVTVTFGTELATTPSYSVPLGADDAYLIEPMSGTVRKMYIRADGVPA